jgi:hypothetical protein
MLVQRSEPSMTSDKARLCPLPDPADNHDEDIFEFRVPGQRINISKML